MESTEDAVDNAQAEADDLSMLRREVPRFKGIYIEGSVEGVEVNYTVDTGATCTIVSSRVFEQIPESDRPTLHKPKLSHVLTSADGRNMAFWGKAEVLLELGSLKIKHKVSVAEIEDEVLLGADILQEEVPADLLLSKGVLVLRGHEVPLQQFRHNRRVNRVQVADDTVVPGMSEALVDVFVDLELDAARGPMIIEPPSPGLDNSMKVLVALSLVDLENNCSVKGRVLNPTMDAVTIYQDQVLGQAETIDGDIHILLDEENTSDNLNFEHVRRIEPPHKGPRTEQLEHTQQPPDTDSQVPDHLVEMYDSALKFTKSVTDQHAIKTTLIAYADIFSRDENDLGFTHLTEHTIDTGNARPVKQPPRRTPIAFQGEEREAVLKLQNQGSMSIYVPMGIPIGIIAKKERQSETLH